MLSVIKSISFFKNTSYLLLLTVRNNFFSIYTEEFVHGE